MKKFTQTQFDLIRSIIPTLDKLKSKGYGYSISWEMEANISINLCEILLFRDRDLKSQRKRFFRKYIIDFEFGKKSVDEAIKRITQKTNELMMKD